MINENQRPSCGEAGNLGGLTIHTGTRSQFGSCNFCTSMISSYEGRFSQRPDNVVHQISGHSLQVRVCDHCLKKIQNYKP